MSAEVKAALRGQYGAALAMFRECLAVCPDDLWDEGKPPRPFWRIAYHALYYTDLYLAQNADAFTPWDRHRDGIQALWGRAKRETPYTQAELLAYLDDLAGRMPGLLEAMDLDATDCGYSWYSMNKLEHQFVNLRHVGGHIGQLSELLMARGITIDWVSSA